MEVGTEGEYNDTSVWCNNTSWGVLILLMDVMITLVGVLIPLAGVLIPLVGV